MKDFIGLPLNIVKDKLNKAQKAYIIYENNFNVDGDTTLVTNVKYQNDTIILTVGEFIFDLEGKQ